MKKAVVFFCAVIALASCRQGNVIDKPENLLEEDEMVNVMYDLSLLQAIQVQNPDALREKDVSPQAYIFRKYDIDSTTLAQNQKYYASRIEQYEKMQQKVADKIKEQKEALAAASKKDSAAPAKKVK